MDNVFLHVGFPKTATTTLQLTLQAYGEGCDYLGKGLRELPEPDLSLEIAWAALYVDTTRFEAMLPGLRARIAARAAATPCLVISDEAFTFVEYMTMGPHWPRQAVTDHAVTAERLARLCPGAAVLMSVREQTAFLDSFYRQKLKRMTADADFAEWVQREIGRLGQRSMLHALRYDEAVEAYAARFGANRVHVSAYETYRTDFGRYLDEVAGMTGLQPERLRAAWGGLHANPDLPKRRQRSVVKRLRTLTPAPLRRFLPGRLRAGLLDALAKPAPEVAMPEPAAEAIRAHFAAPNRALAECTGLDLEALGYPVAPGERRATA